MNSVKKAVIAVGGAAEAAKICNVSPRAVYKWLASGSLPRTDYTGETNYAELLATAARGAFTAESLLVRSDNRNIAA